MGRNAKPAAHAPIEHQVAHMTEERAAEIARQPGNVVLEWDYINIPPPSNDVLPHASYAEIGNTILRASKNRAEGVTDIDLSKQLMTESPTVRMFARTFPRVFRTLTKKTTEPVEAQLALKMLHYRSQVLTGELTAEQAQTKAMSDALEACKDLAPTQPVYVPDGSGVDLRLG